MATFAQQIDPLMTRLRRILARGVAATLQLELSKVAKNVAAAAQTWRSPDELTAEYWQSKAYPKKAKERWAKLAERLSSAIAKTNQKVNRAQFKQMIIEAVRRYKKDSGLALSGDTKIILDGPKVQARMKIFTEDSASLIKDIPEQYIESVARDARDAYTGKLTHKEYKAKLAEILNACTVQEKERCARIATDQVRKCAAVLTQSRCEDNGIDEYIWRCSKDDLVAGKPGGLYPKADDRSKYHGDHWARNGKKFRWDSPPPDGHPGYPINCRCDAEPIITSFV